MRRAVAAQRRHPTRARAGAGGRALRRARWFEATGCDGAVVRIRFARARLFAIVMASLVAAAAVERQSRNMSRGGFLSDSDETWLARIRQFSTMLPN